jgi:hypothetical protein
VKEGRKKGEGRKEMKKGKGRKEGGSMTVKEGR